MATTRPYQGFPYTNPTIIDVPSIDRTDQWAHLPRKPINPPKIDIPTTRINTDGDTPDYVQDTIMYNPFEDSRINISSPKEETNTSNDATRIYIPPGPRDEPNAGSNAYNLGPYNPYLNDRNNPNINNTPNNPNFNERPTNSNFNDRPNPNYNDRPSNSNSNYNGPGPSNTSNLNRAPDVPSFMSKEASIYQQSDDDGFPLSPIPVSEFPEPPPAYSEIDRVRPGQVRPENQTNLEPVTTPPRTQVIVPPRAVEPPRTLNEDRQYLKCPHCEKQVNTVMLRESGVATHVAAWFLFFVFFPITIFIYCTEYCKYKNHYCPECSKLVGYEIPMTCQEFVFAEKSP